MPLRAATLAYRSYRLDPLELPDAPVVPLPLLGVPAEDPVPPEPELPLLLEPELPEFELLELPVPELLVLPDVPRELVPELEPLEFPVEVVLVADLEVLADGVVLDEPVLPVLGLCKAPELFEPVPSDVEPLLVLDDWANTCEHRAVVIAAIASNLNFIEIS